MTVSLWNSGRIVANGFGVSIQGTNNDIRNMGLISGNCGIIAGSGHIINEKGGEIVGITYGAVGQNIENYGQITGDIAVFLDGDGTLINKGTIDGNVKLGHGSDLVDTRGGIINGVIRGGYGRDTLITDDARILLLEESRAAGDTVKSSVSYNLSENVEKLVLLGRKDIDGKGSNQDNILTGSGGNNILSGMSGSDKLDGGQGSDRLSGGAGRDYFIFARGDGSDTITDFAISPTARDETYDAPVLNGWQDVRNFSEVMEHARNVDGNILIELGGDSITLLDVQKNELTEQHFFIN